MILAFITPYTFPLVLGLSIAAPWIESGLRDQCLTVHIFSSGKKGIPA
jgi:hypothetical protein